MRDGGDRGVPSAFPGTVFSGPLHFAFGNIAGHWSPVRDSDGSTLGTLRTQRSKPIRSINEYALPNKNRLKNRRRQERNSGIDIITDADRQFHFEDLEQMILVTDTADFCQGIRIKRADRMARVIIGKVYQRMIRMLFRAPGTQQREQLRRENPRGPEEGARLSPREKTPCETGHKRAIGFRRHPVKPLGTDVAHSIARAL